MTVCRYICVVINQHNAMKWNISDWNTERLLFFKHVRSFDKVSAGGKDLGYLLRLDHEMGYREFMLYDNGGEVNFREIGKDNPHFFDSMPLPVNGSWAQTNESILYYRIMQWIKNEPIDYGRADDSMTEADFQHLETALGVTARRQGCKNAANVGL